MRSDGELAGHLAERAGVLLLSIREAAGTAGGDKELGHEGDQRSNDLILSTLAVERPDDAVLSEESTDDPVRLTASRVWIVDPLDGTREFTMPGRSDWAVHVALWERGRGITAAAVSQPALGETYVTGNVVASSESGTAPTVVVSDSRPPAFAPEVAKRIGGTVTPMGSAGAKAMAVLRGDADVYLHAGGQWEWDSAAPVGVTLSAGLHASRIDGSPLLYNEANPYLPDLLICRKDVASSVLDALKACGVGR